MPMITPNGHGLGWRRDLPDQRDRFFQPPPHLLAVLPASVDLRSGKPGMPGVYDQGQIGSCTGNAIAGAIEYEFRKNHQHEFVPARLFIYWNERALEGTTGSDSGAQIRDGIKATVQWGACAENPQASGVATWPYDPNKLYNKPSAACYTAARKDLVSAYARVNQTENDMKACLASGWPIVFGFTVYESFESDAVASTGIVPMPGPDEEVLGGHAVLCVGYDDTKQTWTVRNSWGKGWGDKGYAHFPYEYLTDPNLSSDLWQITGVN